MDSVENLHTFFVGPHSVLVHNSSACPTGQLHHILSKGIMDAVKDHANLADEFTRNMPGYLYRAADAAAHRGYQDCHRLVDKEAVEWVKQWPNATPAQFVNKLQEIYNRTDIAKRIPNVDLPKLFGL